MFKIIILGVAVITALIPFVVPIVARRMRTKTNMTSPLFPLAAALLFTISFYLPDVHISNQTTTFQQHFVGGGMYSALLYVYFKRLLGWKFRWPSDIVVLFAWVSALGVANKLLEFGLAETHLLVLDMSDAYWDLLANTLGAFVAYAIVIIMIKISRAR